MPVKRDASKGGSSTQGQREGSPKLRPTRPGTPELVDEYLAGLPDDARAALQELRETIRAAAPEAAEVISYRMPSFSYHGMLVCYAAFKDHCSLFPGTGAMGPYEEEAAPYRTSKGTLRFTPSEPLPAALVKKIVRARMRENEGG